VRAMGVLLRGFGVEKNQAAASAAIGA